MSQGLNDSEIAAQLGVNRWMIQRDVKLMQYNRDPGLKQAESSREVIRSEKSACLMGEKVNAKQNERFVGMTGMTLEEKSFRNMIDFHRSQLMRIMNAEDQDAAIRALPKSTRKTMRNNGIVKDWRITAGAEKYLVSV
jgi:hypothetical protein